MYIKPLLYNWQGGDIYCESISKPKTILFFAENLPTDGVIHLQPITVRNLPTKSVSLFGLRATVIQPIVPIEVKRIKH